MTNNTTSFLFLILLTLVFVPHPSQSQEKNKILFFQTDWGRTLPWDTFCEKTKAAGYDGIETWFPKNKESLTELETALQKHGLQVIYLAGTDKTLDFASSLKKYKKDLESIVAAAPAAVNCHTGSDFFTFEQNRAFIEAANTISKENNIPIYHETHRGRFSFNLPGTQKSVKAIPDLKLNLDISHWMVVHESLLENQEPALTEVIDRTHHIHTRVGHAEGPQVNDPAAPEWQGTLERHLAIWETIIKKRWAENNRPVTITTEFGPPAYMPTLPYTQVPVADQWQANLFIMQALKDKMGVD